MPEVAAIAAQYHRPAYGTLVVERVGGTYRFSLGGDLTGRLVRLAPDTFALRWDDPVLAWGLPLRGLLDRSANWVAFLLPGVARFYGPKTQNGIEGNGHRR